uniref:Secreted protein n=1 Tax=Plectus sambesii TaxID=2011161 RepID=A0A914VKJ3_9BILA
MLMGAATDAAGGSRPRSRNIFLVVSRSLLVMRGMVASAKLVEGVQGCAKKPRAHQLNLRPGPLDWPKPPPDDNRSNRRGELGRFFRLPPTSHLPSFPCKLGRDCRDFTTLCQWR